MIEGGSLPARCADCQQTFRVAAADRAYTCRACGGTVRAVTAVHHLEGTVTCAQCSAINVHNAQFCAGCHALLGESPAVRVTGEEMRLRREASSELRRGYRWITAVSWLFRLGAVGYAAVTVVAVMALRSTEVPVGPGVLVVALATLLTVTMLMGAIQILFQPLLWTVVVAALATAVTVAHLIGPNPLGLASVWSGAWAIGFWAAVLPMWRFRRLMAAHTDLYIAHHASHQTKRSLEGRSPAERHERLVRAMRRASQRAWSISAVSAVGLCLVSGLGAYLVWANLRPHGLQPALARFEAAWNDNNLAAVDRQLSPVVRGTVSARVAAIVEGHGWRYAMPKLANGRSRSDGDSVWIDYQTEAGVVQTRWVLRSQDWYATALELPQPPLEPVLQRFYSAWRDSDVAAIAALVPPTYQQRMHESIERALERRDWQRLPEILTTQRGTAPDGEVAIALSVAGGTIDTKWRYRVDGRWGLQSIQFPKR